MLVEGKYTIICVQAITGDRNLDEDILISLANLSDFYISNSILHTRLMEGKMYQNRENMLMVNYMISVSTTTVPLGEKKRI